MQVTAFSLAQRWVGTKELPGQADNPFVLGMLRLDATWPEHDEVPWCSAFVNFVCWLLRLPRSKSLAAQSWLQVGVPVDLSEAVVGFDVVVFSRAGSAQAGHVGFYGGLDAAAGRVWCLGGNQSDAVTLASFPKASVLGVRRLAPPEGSGGVR